MFLLCSAVIELPVLLVTWQDAVGDAGIASSSSSGSGSDSGSYSPSSSSSDEEAHSGGRQLYTSSQRGTFIVADTFHTYVQPTARPRISEFCTQLTGITQERLKGAPTFPEAVLLLYHWLNRHELLRDHWTPQEIRQSCGAISVTDWRHPAYSSRLKSDTIWCTHGPFDLRDFVYKQCWISEFPFGPPEWLRGTKIFDIRRAVGAWKQQQQQQRQQQQQQQQPPRQTTPAMTPDVEPPILETADAEAVENAAAKMNINPVVFRDGTIPALLADLGLGEFQGRPHSGLDDTRNLARILIELGHKVSQHVSTAVAKSDGVDNQNEGSESVEDGFQAVKSNNRISRPPGKQEGKKDCAIVEIADLLQHNIELRWIPAVPTDNAIPPSKAGTKWYPRRYEWMGKRPGVVKWALVEGTQAEPEKRL